MALTVWVSCWEEVKRTTKWRLFYLWLLGIVEGGCWLWMSAFKVAKKLNSWLNSWHSFRIWALGTYTIVDSCPSHECFTFVWSWTNRRSHNITHVGIFVLFFPQTFTTHPFGFAVNTTVNTSVQVCGTILFNITILNLVQVLGRVAGSGCGYTQRIPLRRGHRHLWQWVRAGQCWDGATFYERASQILRLGSSWTILDHLGSSWQFLAYLHWLIWLGLARPWKKALSKLIIPKSQCNRWPKVLAAQSDISVIYC